MFIMESIQIGTIVALAGFIYTYMKDRYSQGESIGRLKQRVENLENDRQVLETLSQTLTETRLVVTRLEQKVDMFLERD